MGKLIILIAILFCFSAKAQIITTIAGTGTVGFSGDGGQATASELNGPNSLAKDAAGNLYIADYQNNVIRKINTAGIITTIAGNNTAGYSGDGGQASLAELNSPTGLLVDNVGNIFICDEGNNGIRKINTSGIITTIAGNHIAGYTGDGGQASLAELNNPTGLALDVIGNIYVADVANQVIRKINTAGIITTVAGNNTAGFSGDGGQATAAQLNLPFYMAIDAANNIYIADGLNNVIRKVNTTGIISTFAGNHIAGYSGDGGNATSAELTRPEGVAIDSVNNVYIGDWNNHVIRKVHTSGIISTIAGTGIAGYSGDGGMATSAQLNHPLGIMLDGCQLYFADQDNNRIRQVNLGLTLTVTSPTICTGTTATLTAMGANTYTWSTGATISIGATITPSPTATTNYTVTGADGNNCAGTNTVSITVDTLPRVIAHLTSTFTPICSGDSIILSQSGAKTYTWTSTSYTFTAADSVLNGVKFPPKVGTDTFNLKGRDSTTGCVNTATISVVVKQSPTIIVTPANPPTICPGGSATFTVSGAGVVSYTWSPKTVSPSDTSTSITVSPTITTSYQVLGTDTNGCVSGNQAYVIIPRDSIIVNSAVICQSNSVTLNASSIAVSYTWSPATGLSSVSGSSVIASPRGTTIYTIKGTDHYGCMGVNTATVTVDSLPIITTSKTPTITCSGQPAVLTASGASTYTWSTGTVGITNTVSPTTNTEYTVVGTDTNGCSNSTTQILLVNPLPPVAINSGITSMVINSGSSITLNASGALTYSWTSGNTGCDSCASNTESPVASTQYCVAGTDINGCRDTVCIKIVVENVCDVYIPDAFSPNGDGENDEFKVYGHCITELTLQVFDRWGNQVFKGGDPSAAWDGSYGGSIMNTGTYVYQVQYTLNTGEKVKTKGNFSLMR
jgi:gliding motility-associated-like protein